MSGKAHTLEDIGLLDRINWPVWAPAMRLALQSISAFCVASGEQAKPPTTQPWGQLFKDYTYLCNDYDSKDTKGRTLIRSHVDGNTWFKVNGSAAGASLHQVWTDLVKMYDKNSVPFVGTKTVGAYWNLRYEPGTSVTTFITDVKRLSELCNRQKIAFWLQQRNIDQDELEGIYGTIISALGQACGKALREMIIHKVIQALLTDPSRGHNVSVLATEPLLGHKPPVLGSLKEVEVDASDPPASFLRPLLQLPRAKLVQVRAWARAAL